MKRNIIILLTLTLLFSLCSCRQDGIREPFENPTYILNKNSLVYHDPDCKHLPDRENQIEIEYEDIEHNPEYRPCGHCKPE